MGIYIHNSLSNVGLLDEINIVLECDCMKCEVESLFVEFMFNGAMYTVGVTPRTPLPAVGLTAGFGSVRVNRWGYL